MGSYSKLKGEDGNYIDNSWENAKNIIGNASVFLNSFPISGASSTWKLCFRYYGINNDK